MIRVEALTWRTPDRTILGDVTFDVARGEAVAVTGPEISRAALLRILATLLRPSAGHASIDGADLVADVFRVRRDVFLAGLALPLPDVTVAEYLHFLRNTRSRRRKVPAPEVIERGELPADVTLARLNAVQRRRLGLMSAVVAAPKVVLLEADHDDDREFLASTIGELKAQGATVLANATAASALWERTIDLEDASRHQAVVA